MGGERETKRKTEETERQRDREREEADELDVEHNSKNAAKGDLRGLWTVEMEEWIGKVMKGNDL